MMDKTGRQFNGRASVENLNFRGTKISEHHIYPGVILNFLNSLFKISKILRSEVQKPRFTSFHLTLNTEKAFKLFNKFSFFIR